MNNYEYIIASLPVLSSDFRGELDCDDIIEQLCEQLDRKDARSLALLLDGFDSEKLCEGFYREALKSHNAFIRRYFLYDLYVRNLKVEYLNRELGRPEKQDVLDLLGEEFEFEDAEKVGEVLSRKDILARERGLDDLMWNEIDSLCGLQVFSPDVIFGFVAKLQIVARWLKLDPQSGRELFKTLVEEIRNNKKPII